MRWSRAYIDAGGAAQMSTYEVPVDADDRHTGHIRHTCPQLVEDGEPCDYEEWLEAGAPPGYCPDHGGQLVAASNRRTAPILPWEVIWRDLRPTLAAPAAAGAALAGAAAAAESAGVAAGLLATTALPTSAAAWWAARWWQTRRAVEEGKLDDAESVTGARARNKIGRRARTVGYCTAGAGCWLAAASVAGLDPATAGGVWSWLSLAAATAAFSYPWRRYVHTQRRRTEPEPEPVELDVPLDVLEAEARRIWETRVDAPGGPLPDTSLDQFRRISGGWAAAIVPDVPGAIDPDKFASPIVVRRVAAAYQVPVMDVTIELNPDDASTGTISMQRENPLYTPRVWTGPADTCDWEAGLLRAGWFADDSPVWYRWWNAGGPPHELIAGCTGSGKSEFTQLLILAELHSGGLVLSRVVDPQDGQSFGELQDHVDWFAGHIAEAQILLLDTVMEMRRRNRVYSRRRQKTWKPCAEFPLISLTIDEAHEVLRDPICLALVEKLAKMARKCGIKIRLITQVPTVTEIGNSTPIKDALLAGQLFLFRTGSPISAQVALNGTLNVDPHKIPPEWPKGTPAAGTTTAGVGFSVGVDRREMAMRTCYTGAEEDLPTWLRDQAGNSLTSPGVPSQEMVDWSGPLWGQRHERIAAWHDAPPDDSDILPGELVQVLRERAAGQPPAQGASPPAAAGKPVAPESTAKALVLRAAVANADAAGQVDRGTLAKQVRTADGEAMPSRTLSKAITDLIEGLMLGRVKNGVYEVTDKARAEVRAEAEQAVTAMLDDAEVELAGVS